MVTRFEQLRNAVAVLAETASGQLRYLAVNGFIDGATGVDSHRNIDELALQFEDANYLTRSLAQSGLLTEAAEKCIRKLDAELLKFSGKDADGFWTVSGLECDTRWAYIRELARECLSKM